MNLFANKLLISNISIALLYTLSVFHLGPWYFFGADITLLVLFEILLAAYVLVLWKQKFKFPVLPVGIILFFYSLLFLLFPVKNLALGDGVLLLENVLLESKIFGFQLTLDEILEAIIHSRLHLAFFSDPRDAYQTASTVAGFASLFLLHGFIKNSKMGLAETLVLLASGGMFLFFGYIENYTLTTLLLLVYILYIRKLVADGKQDLAILVPATLLAVLAVLFHMVAGYLIVSLVYLAATSSKKNSFWYNAFISTFIAALVLVPVFSYFLFFSDPTADRMSTILLHPPFYSLKKMVSANHFSELAGTLLFNALPSVPIIVYILLWQKQVSSRFLQKKENRFLLAVAAGFVLHGLLHTPQLGFPADWDLLGFYWLPLTLVSMLLLAELSNGEKNFFLPFLLFALGINLINMKEINKPDPAKEIRLLHIASLVEQYANVVPDLSHIPKNSRKFYIKTDFFLFRTISDLQNRKHTAMTEEGMGYKRELKTRFQSGSADKQWLGDYLTRLTDYHLRYLAIAGKNH